MKQTDKKLEETKIPKSESNTLLPKKEKTLSQRLKEMPYSESKIGQGFVMNWKMPKK